MNIQWNKVTWYSILSAIIIFVGVYFLGFYVGHVYQAQKDQTMRLNGMMMRRGQNMHVGTSTPTAGSTVISAVDFSCANTKTIHANFMAHSVNITLSDGRTMTLQQVVSADGGRYANSDESFVFWTVGQGATITESGQTTYQNCAVVPDSTKG